MRGSKLHPFDLAAEHQRSNSRIHPAGLRPRVILRVIRSAIIYSFLTYRTQPSNIPVCRRSGARAAGGLLARHFVGVVAANRPDPRTG